MVRTMRVLMVWMFHDLLVQFQLAGIVFRLLEILCRNR